MNRQQKGRKMEVSPNRFPNRSIQGRKIMENLKTFGAPKKKWCLIGFFPWFPQSNGHLGLKKWSSSAFRHTNHIHLVTSLIKYPHLKPIKPLFLMVKDQNSFQTHPTSYAWWYIPRNPTKKKKKMMLVKGMIFQLIIIFQNKAVCNVCKAPMLRLQQFSFFQILICVLERWQALETMLAWFSWFPRNEHEAAWAYL